MWFFSNITKYWEKNKAKHLEVHWRIKGNGKCLVDLLAQAEHNRSRGQHCDGDRLEWHCHKPMEEPGAEGGTSLQRETDPMDTLVLDFWPPEFYLNSNCYYFCTAIIEKKPCEIDNLPHCFNLKLTYYTHHSQPWNLTTPYWMCIYVNCTLNF